MIRYRARWLVPICEPPIRDGWVAVDRGRIVAFGRPAPGDTQGEQDLGHVAILPGLVNAHTHLELSYLRDQIDPASDFVTWIRGVVAARQQRPDPKADEIMDAVDAAIAESTACGTAIVGDISNTLVTFDPLVRSSLAGVVFYEMIRFAAAGAERVVAGAMRNLDGLVPTDVVRVGLAAHAPYSVAPLLFRAIRAAARRDPLAPCSVHLSESAEEVEFIKTGTGPWRTFLEEVRAWDPAWVAPGVSPVRFLEDCGFLDARVLAVHGVQMSSDDLKRLTNKRSPSTTTSRRSCAGRSTRTASPPDAGSETSSPLWQAT